MSPQRASPRRPPAGAAGSPLATRTVDGNWRPEEDRAREEEWSAVVVGLGTTAAHDYTEMMAVVSGRFAFSARQTVLSWPRFRQRALCAAWWENLACFPPSRDRFFFSE
jgi:hypothetical protein